MNATSCHRAKIYGKTVFYEEIHTCNNKYQENIKRTVYVKVGGNNVRLDYFY